MKQVKGIWLPDCDTHFASHLDRGPEFAGAGTYQFSKIEAALNVTPGRRAALDIGGHVGLWSRVLARHFQKVVAIEPAPEAIECFRANTADCENVKLIEAAVSDRSGEIKIGLSADNSGNSHVLVDERSKSFITIPAIRIDDLGFEGFDLVKIDVEGWELQVLRGAERFIRREKPVIVIEQKTGNAERYGIDRFAAIRLLDRWGAIQLWKKSGDFCFGWQR